MSRALRLLVFVLGVILTQGGCGGTAHEEPRAQFSQSWQREAAVRSVARTTEPGYRPAESSTWQDAKAFYRTEIAEPLVEMAQGFNVAFATFLMGLLVLALLTVAIVIIPGVVFKGSEMLAEGVLLVATAIAASYAGAPGWAVACLAIPGVVLVFARIIGVDEGPWKLFAVYGPLAIATAFEVLLVALWVIKGIEHGGFIVAITILDLLVIRPAALLILGSGEGGSTGSAPAHA